MNGRIAVFGGKGYLGSQLVAYFKNQHREVICLDMPEFDICSPHFWKSFNPAEYEAILFFSGLTGVERSFAEAESFIKVNVGGTYRLLQRISKFGEDAPYVIFPSTRLVYQGAEVALDEDAPKDPKTVYAVTKLADEALLRAYSIRYGVRYAVLRVCVPYGNIVTDNYSYGTVGFFIRQAQSGRVTVYGDGMLKRTFTHVSDMCRIVDRMLGKKIVGVYNLGGETLTLGHVAKMIASRYSAEVSFVPWPELDATLESGSTFFDSSKLDFAIDFTKYCDFESCWSNDKHANR